MDQGPQHKTRHTVSERRESGEMSVALSEELHSALGLPEYSPSDSKAIMAPKKGTASGGFVSRMPLVSTVLPLPATAVFLMYLFWSGHYVKESHSI